MMKLAIFLTILACALAARPPYRPRLDGRIVGGEDVDIEDYPYQLSLILSYANFHMCGASIISENWALCASHCVDGRDPEELSLRSGSSIVGTGGTVHDVKRIIMHPKYGNLDWDYSLLEVEQPFELGKPGVQAIKLNNEAPAAGTEVVVSGWGALSQGGGSPDQLQAVTVSIVSQEECEDAYGSITERMICAAVPEGGKDSCQGDSGGPLVNKETGEQTGVVSWGAGCAQKGYPGVYSNIAAVREWIKENTGV